MTRAEWVEQIDCMGELVSWCYNNGYENFVEDYISDDTLDEYVNNDICNYDYGWMDLRDALNDVPTGYDWYRVDGSLDYVGLDEYDFGDIKDEVLDQLDTDEFFDDEEEEEETGPVSYRTHEDGQNNDGELPTDWAVIHEKIPDLVVCDLTSLTIGG